MAAAASPAEATSPADEESTSNRVQVIVDGIEISTHAPPDGVRITEDDLLLRFRQTSEAVKHMNFLFLGNQYHVTIYAN